LDIAIKPLVRESVASRNQRRAHRRIEFRVRFLKERVGRQELMMDSGCCDSRIERQVEIVPVGQYLEY
jgi:hypothetical protein